MSKTLQEFRDSIEQEEKSDNKWQELKEKKLLVETHRYGNELEKINKNKKDSDDIANIKVDAISDEIIDDIVSKNRLYLEGAKNGLSFLTPDLGKIVPMWPGNIILIGSLSGSGKSSTATNLALNTMKQINPLAGKNRKVLYISNEETMISFMNKMTCACLGYNYNALDDFNEEQKQKLIEFMPKWAKAGLTILGEDSIGTTTCLEGISGIFEQLIKTNTMYDLVILDYIQKVSSSKKDSRMVHWQVMKETMYVLDYYKDRYPAPIVVMSQLKETTEENPLNFQNRIEGFKGILQPATVALELVPNRKLLQSRWYVRKNRYKGHTVGRYLDVAYDNGIFKPLTEEWKSKIAKTRDGEEWQEAVGKYVEDKKDSKTKESKE